MSHRALAVIRRGLLPFVAVALVAGAVASIVGADDAAVAVWSVASGVVAVELVVVTISRLREGRIAVDVVALVALLGAIVMGEALAGVILALMVASGDALEQYAHRRAKRSLSELLSLAPKVGHRLVDGSFETVPVDQIAPGEVLLVKPGEVVPVDGTVMEPAVLDESVLTGEAQSVQREVGEWARSGSLNAGGAFRMSASASADESSYAGIVRLVQSAGVGRAPFVRLADRYAVMFVPAVFLIAGGTWLITGDTTRVLAVLVVATPCPLVLAAPVAVVSGHRLRGAERRGGQGRRRAGGDGADTNGAVGQDRHADRRPRARRCGGDLTGRRSGLGAGVGSIGGAGIAACAGRDARARGT